jgi:Cu/Zn superoxide dismutase
MTDKSVANLFTEEHARKFLEQWAKTHGIILIDEFSMTCWLYMERPFWAAVGTGMRGGEFGQYGFHIHENGEVNYIGRMNDGENH